MGYWDMGVGGGSFEKSSPDEDNQMVWGDQVADIVDGAIDKIKIAFLMDMGRMPSKAEIRNGIMFSTNGLDGLAEEPKDAPHATEEQYRVIVAYGGPASGGNRLSTPDERDAQKQIGMILEMLEVKP